MKPTTLFFSKHFTKGLLKGLTHTDSLTFPDVDHAARWLKAVRQPSKRRTWELVDASFQKFTR